jgi:hypothetical protein
MNSDFSITLLAMLSVAGLAVLAGWRGARPPDLSRGPRLVPWRPIMMLSAVVLLLLLVHLLNLLGVETGKR